MQNEHLNIKELIDDADLLSATELRADELPKRLVNDPAKAMNAFDAGHDIIHYVVSIKRPKSPAQLATTATAQTTTANTPDPFNDLVNETFSLADDRARRRERGEPEYSPEYLLENARILKESGDLSLARNIYKTLIKRGESISEGLMGLASTFEIENNLIDAERHYREALAYSSGANIYQSLISTLIKQGKDEDAARYLIHASGLPALSDEQRFEFHKTLGNCYARIGETDKAAYQYEKAYELCPNSDALQVNVGSLALQKGDYISAKQHFNKAVEINNKNEKAINGLGMVFMAIGDTQKAHDLFLAALEIENDNIGAIHNLVKVAYDLRKFDATTRVLERYMRKKPESRNNTNILYCYCGILYHQGHLNMALEEADRILAINAQHAGAKEIKSLIKSANQGR